MKKDQEPADARLRDLPLREFRPTSSSRTPVHAVPRARFAAVDAHNHLGRWLTSGSWAAPDVEQLLATLDSVNVEAVVNLDGRWGDELEANLDRYDRAHPGRFATFCQLDWSETAEVGFGERLAGSLVRSAAAGAKGLKVWKDLGLHVRDGAGALVSPDDARLDAVWSAAAELGLPVLIHTADPIAFFEPLDETNERLEELLENPDWWYGDRARFPAFQDLMDALEALVARHPATTFIAAHAGCAEDVGWLSRMFDSYPNFNADFAARIAELGRTPRSTRELFLRHPDRLLFGTDAFPPDAETYRIGLRFLETGDESFPYSPEVIPPQGRWSVSGLELPDDVLTAVEGGNARRLILGSHDEASDGSGG